LKKSNSESDRQDENLKDQPKGRGQRGSEEPIRALELSIKTLKA